MNVLYQCDSVSRQDGCPWEHGRIRANDVFDDKTLAVLCSVCGLLMHKLIKYLLMSKRLSDYLLIQL